MDKNQYEKYLREKIDGFEPTLLSAWFKIDGLKSILEFLPSCKWYFKGALNLLLNHNYRREGELTKDMDLSIRDMNVQQFSEELKNSLANAKHSIYAYKFIKIEPLSIATNGYEGIRIVFNIKVKELNMNTNIDIDLAIEELEEGFECKDEMNVYSIERTMADKYVTMIQRWRNNSREKDFQDLKALYSRLDIKRFCDLSKKLLIKREVSKEEISYWKQNFKEIDFVKKYKLQDTLEQINESTL